MDSNPPPAPPPTAGDAPSLRQRFIDAAKLNTHREPYEWQLDMAEALHDRRDVFCVASTGAGKTLPYVLNCLIDPRTVVWLVSPLNYIERQQEKTFKDWNIRACSVNATTSYPGIYKDIVNGKYQVIITSPERLLEYNKLRPILIQLSAEGWNNIVIIDECHCICIWSDQFRKTYGLLGTLRIFLLPGTPFCAATATATHSMREQILSSLRYSENHLFINRGYWKPNLSWHVHWMKGGDGSVTEITHLFPTGLEATSILPMTIVFVDKRTLAFKILAVFRNFLPPALVDQVEVYHALQSDIAKDYAAQRFEQGKVRILICTEALTMGCDFRNIELVVLFKVPLTLPTVLQRGGRGGRDKNIWCRVVLMVEASKRGSCTVESAEGVKRSKSKRKGEKGATGGSSGQKSSPVKVGDTEDAPATARDEAVDRAIDVDTIESLEREEIDLVPEIVVAQHGKEDAKLLREFYMTSGCRTKILDRAFESPPHPACITVNGCDNCIRKRIAQLEAGDPSRTHSNVFRAKQEDLEGRLEPSDNVESLRALLVQPCIENEPAKRAPRNKYRPTDEREPLQKLIEKWRLSTYGNELKLLGAPIDYIITDSLIQAIARLLPPVTPDSLLALKTPWPKKAMDLWGGSLLEVVNEYDTPAELTDRHNRRLEKRRLGGVKRESDSAGAEHSPKRVKTQVPKVSLPSGSSGMPLPSSSQSSSNPTIHSHVPAALAMGRPVGTRIIQVHPQPTPVQPVPGSQPHSEPAHPQQATLSTSTSHSLPLKNPGASRSYYRGHLFK